MIDSSHHKATPARTPAPPYYAAIFSTQRRPGDAGYAEVAERMDELAAAQPGYLGVESARDAQGFGITVSYWSSEEAIVAWRNQAEHVAAQMRGRREWYASYTLRIALVERERNFPAR